MATCIKYMVVCCLLLHPALIWITSVIVACCDIGGAGASGTIQPTKGKAPSISSVSVPLGNKSITTQVAQKAKPPAKSLNSSVKVPLNVTNDEVTTSTVAIDQFYTPDIETLTKPAVDDNATMAEKSTIAQTYAVNAA